MVTSITKNSQSFSIESNSSSINFCDNCNDCLNFSLLKAEKKTLLEFRKRCAKLHKQQRMYLDGLKTITDVQTIPSSTMNTSYSSSELQLELVGVAQNDGDSNSFEEVRRSTSSELKLPLIYQPELPHLEKGIDWQVMYKNAINEAKHKCRIINHSPSVPHLKKASTKRTMRKLPKITSKNTSKPRRGAMVGSKYLPKSILDPQPREIVFGDLEIGLVAKKHLKITNISSKNCTLTVAAVDRNSQFSVKSSQPLTSVMLSPGMSLRMVIEFKCISLANTREELVINIHNEDDLVIPLIATSPPPHLIEVINQSCNVFDGQSDMHSFIDCGTSFVGDKINLQLELRNDGSFARFCFVSEENWHNLEFEMDYFNILKTDSFEVEPMLFSLAKNQSIQWTVSFCPPAEGFHTAQAFVLCSNTTVKKIDFTGDGFLFDPSWTEFLGMAKTFDVDIEDDSIAEYYLDFGEMLTSSKRQLFFFLAHNGFVNMSYHWEIRQSSIPSASPLPPQALQITPASGRLKAKSVEPFCLSCDTENLTYGTYRMILSFIIDDLPLKCLSPESQENIPAENKNYNDECSVSENDLVSVKNKYVEVWMQCVQPKITIFPYTIDFPDSTLFCGAEAEIREVVVENHSPGTIHMEWACAKSPGPQTEISVTPKQFVCKDFSTVVCTFSVKPILEGDFFSVFKLISDKDVCLDLQIGGYNREPCPEIVTKIVNFGLIKPTSEQNCLVTATNNSDMKMWWSVDEFCFENSEGIMELKPSVTGGKLSAHSGVFCHKGSEVIIRYELNTDIDRLFCSVLDWSGVYIPIIANIESTDVSLSAYTVKPEILYLGVQTTVKVFVKNHTAFPTAILWGNIISKHLRCLTVEINPRFAILKSNESLSTEIHLIPNIVGSLDNVYVPCFVELQPQPLLLKIEGDIEGLKVRVEWDYDKKHHCIYWPNESSANRELRSLDSVICKCPPNSSTQLIRSSVITEYDDLEEIINIHSSDIEEGSINAHSTDVFHKELKDCISREKFDQHSYERNASLSQRFGSNCLSDSYKQDYVGEHNVSQTSSIPYLNWPIVGGRYYRPLMSPEMERHYWDLFTLEMIREESNQFVTSAENEFSSLHFTNISLKQITTQTIYIRNDTLINSCFEICILNNFERQQNPEVKCVPEKIQKYLNHKYNAGDQRISRASKERGLTVFVEPSSGLLSADDYVVVNVSAFASSWGVYTDYLLIQLDNLEQLCIKMCVTVNQHPVKVPDVLKFGSVSTKYHSDLQKIKVENTSTVPVYIIWQLFTPDDEDGSAVTQDEAPFGVTLYDAEPFQLQMSDYYGSFGSEYFQVLENCTYLMPCSSTKVDIRFTPLPDNFKVCQNEYKKVCKAVLVGTVYLTEEGKSMSAAEECLRVDGMKLEPLKVNIEATLEFPVLSLLNLYKDQLEFKCTANDVMSSENRIWTRERVVTVKNDSNVELTAKVETFGFFSVKSVSYPCQGEIQNYSLTNLIVVPPGKTCQVTLLCEVTDSDLYDTFPEEVFPQPDTDLQVEFYGLLTFKQDFLQQDVELKLTIYPPLIEVSETSLNFGLVYINDKKVLIMTITSLLSNENFEALLENACDSVFSVNITSGILIPKKCLILQISFSPKGSGFYRDSLIIKSCFDRIHWEIPLTGFGTYDYKTHIYHTSD